MNVSTNTQKSTVFNLIILDESGSMGCVKKQTINGCNETIDMIIDAHKKHSNTVNSFASIFSFNSIAGRYIIKNQNPETLAHISVSDYYPNGCTPLFDAIGSTVSELIAIADTHVNATAIVTIITDGEENSSHTWNGHKVAQLINRVKEMGWTVNLIGANIDVNQFASEINVDKENTLNWEQTEQGTDAMFYKLSNCNSMVYEEEAEYASQNISPQSRIEKRKVRSKSFWKH